MWRQDTGMQHLAPAPIPTYEEATSRPSSSQRTRGPAETSDDAERQRFLASDGHAAYRQPTVESARNSLDSSLSVPDMVGDDDQDGRRHLEELDYMEPGASDETHTRHARQYHRARLRHKISQQLSSLSATLGAIRLPSFRRTYLPVATETANETPAEETPPTTSSTRWTPALHMPEGYKISIPIFARLMALFMIAAFVWVVFTMDLFPHGWRRHGMAATMFEPESVREYVQEHLDMLEIQHYAEHISSFAHEAGSEGNYFMAKWMQEKWSELCALDTLEFKSFTILADYPVEDERWVKVIGSGGEDWTPSWEEGISPDRPDREQTFAWHGYSKSGSVEGQLIYARHGDREDFATLRERGVNTTGTIAMIDVHGGDSPLQSALKVRFAQDAGCVGVLLCNTDTPNASGQIPAGAVPFNDTVHRVNVALSNWVMGDPLTPGWASLESAKDEATNSSGLPQIPSLPISLDNAVQLRLLLNSGELEGVFDTQSGKSTKVIVNLRNQNDEVRRQKIWNVHATMSGAEHPKHKVIIGAPRDSWCFGASDSASASGILTGIVAIFGELAKLGWTPLRTLEFVSWDARTLNSAGSTEYVEAQIDALREGGVAYINVESAFGNDFYAQGSPVLQRVLQRAMERVVAPGENETMRTIFDTESDTDDLPAVATPLKLPGSDGDFGAFAHIAGVPVLDLGFGGMPQDLVRGSCYDTMHWLDKFGDKRAQIHTAMAQTWALAVLDLVSAPLLPIDTQTFVDRFSSLFTTFAEDVRSYIMKNGPTDKGVALDFDPLKAAIDDLRVNTTAFHKFETDWTAIVMGGGGMEDLHWHRRRAMFNERAVAFEKAFLNIPGPDDERARPGLKDRPQFRHILYAPEKWATGVQILPTVWEILEEKRWNDIQEEIERVAGIIRRAGIALVAD